VETLVECGSAAFGRADHLSDLDLGVVVRDGHVAPCFEAVEAALRGLAPIERTYCPDPGSWAQLTQRFYRLAGVSPYLVVDVCVFEASVPDKVDHPEVHGEARVIFDRGGHQVFEPRDAPAEAARLLGLREQLADRWEMLRRLPLKELQRGKPLEAMGFYQGLQQRILLELLRMKHAPERHGFHTRLIHFDLPEEVQDRLEPLFFLVDPVELAVACGQADDWIRELLEDLRDGSPS